VIRLPRSSDARLLIAGVAAFLALVAYLGVAFATARSSPAATGATIQSNLARIQGKPQVVGPWTARTSHLARVPRRGGRRAIRVTPVTAGLYGIEIKQLVLPATLRRGFAFSFWLRGRVASRLLVQINGGSAAPIRYLLHTGVAVSRRWRRFTYRGRLPRRWIGLGLFVGQTTHKATSRWFEIRDLSVVASPR